ncbi:MAG: T9SS type A sorting domain-containing protein [bacterium]
MMILFVFAQSIWMETTQQDFADGIFEKNVFVSHRNGGALEFVPRFDLNNDGYIDLLTADASGSYVRIYWGSNDGYSEDSVSLFSTTGAANCDAADLNHDNYPDLVVAHRLTPKLTIYWGSPTGPDSSFYFDFPTVTMGRQGVFIADPNKDGFLDIITSQEYIPGYSSIFWGDSIVYSLDRRTDLPSTFGVHNIEIADFNWDSWLDILITEYLHPLNRIYWGSTSGYSPSQYTLLPGPGSHGTSVADLNRDRWLDLIFTAWNGSSCFIYWGNTSGYTTANMDTLYPGSCYGGSAIADMNADGFLDILFHKTSGQQQIYWGRTTGYSDDDTSYVGSSQTATGGLIADLDYDGYLDIFTNSLGPYSRLYWGPTFSTNIQLSVSDDHHAMFREIGNVYNRTYNEFYISSVFDAGDTVNWGTTEWDDSLPTGTIIDMMVHSGNTPSFDSTWSGWFISNNGDSIPDSLNAQYIQYMALLKYTNPAYLPCLYEVRISYDTLTGINTYNEPYFQNPVRISPNPFVINTKISYIVSEPKSTVTIRIYDVTGRIIKTLIDHKHGSGNYDIIWSGDDDENRPLPEGIYYLTFQSDNKTDKRTSFKIIHIRE